MDAKATARRGLISLALCALILTFSAPDSAIADAKGGTNVIHQLRIYEIFEHNKQAFHERFRDHAARIMKKYGFNIVAMWESQHDGRTEFVYVLQWPDEQTMKAAWAGFMADREWAEIKKKTASVHGQVVGGIQDRTLRLTDYSPQRQLLH